MIVASDTTGEQAARPRKATPSVLSEIRRSLTHTRFVGGQDNLAALAAAWDLADAADRGAVLWIHQPQPALLSGESALRQRIERTLKSTRLFDFQVRNGPNRILEKLDGLGAVEQVLPLASTSSGLRELLDQWRGREPEFKLVRERATAPPAGVSGRRVGRHIERLWAREEAMRLASEQKRDEAIRLAAGHQLVTPLTGAVVLETKEQYDTHNLKPADPMTVPAIPEPGVLSVVAVGIAVLLAWRPKPRQPFWRGR
jgi:hypothetical protein